MIKLTENIWVGNSVDARCVDLKEHGISALLNVAHDLDSVRGWRQGIEYAQVGLQDGPGNELADYCAALLCLKMLARKHKTVLVYDHDASRALVVAMMYLNLAGGQWRPNPMAWSHWPTWEERLATVSDKVGTNALTIHQAHIEAFNEIPWSLIDVI